MATRKNTDLDLDKIMGFLADLGFQIQTAPLEGYRFLDGIQIQAGCRLLYDPAASPSPGDLLHEAGHLAILPEPFRTMAQGDVDESIAAAVDDWMSTTPFITTGADMIPTENPVCRALLQAGDVEAQAWSYAAALQCGVDPASVFHRKAYRGAGGSIQIGLRACCHPGINGLVAAGMCRPRSFPRMTKWLQDAAAPAIGRRMSDRSA